MTPSGIEPATFRFVAQHFNHCATAVPHYCYIDNYTFQNAIPRSETDGTRWRTGGEMKGKDANGVGSQ